MPELERALQALTDAPSSPPAPISELERRVSDRRRRHRVFVGAAVSATLLVTMALAPGLLDQGQEESTVRTGPASDAPIVGGPRTPSRVNVRLPAGWQTLYADGDRLVVGTHPLLDEDLLLAGLARDDAAFRAFPAEGVVVVVGGDPAKAKYVADPSSETRTTVVSGGETTEVVTINGFVGPGPAFALGPAKVLPGDVTVRLGDGAVYTVRAENDCAVVTSTQAETPRGGGAARSRQQVVRQPWSR